MWKFLRIAGASIIAVVVTVLAILAKVNQKEKVIKASNYYS